MVFTCGCMMGLSIWKVSGFEVIVHGYKYVRLLRKWFCGCLLWNDVFVSGLRGRNIFVVVEMMVEIFE